MFKKKIHTRLVKKATIWLIFLAIPYGAVSQLIKKELKQSSSFNVHNLIPTPRQLEVVPGFFTLQKNTIIFASNTAKKEASYLQKTLEGSIDFEIKLAIGQKEPSEGIYLYTTSKNQKDESYELAITKQKIIIRGSSTGIIRGIQTLRQLLGADFYLKQKRSSWKLPCVTIKDSPYFQHRGLLLDCCRHFFDKKTVKKYIDLLALYKMNVLHWHLTEDQGWRLAIDKYPKLTEIAAWRKEKGGEIYGGFYSKADVREIVAYAQERAVTIIPEIEIPGHSQAAIAAYPHLSCKGQPVEVANSWGVFKEIYCAGKDSVFVFLEDVLTEVMDLFPSEYIHIGGDEAPKYRWEHCEKCKKRMKDEGLQDEQELQSYFIGRIEDFLNENGRKLIGWDEILEGGLSKNATVQSWRGMDGGIEAAKSGHQAIMSPTSHCYFDYDLKSIDLEKVYRFDPIPPDLPKELKNFILGGECNMWTERVPDEQSLDSKVFPRMLAMSEVLWCYPETRDYSKFYQRVQFQYPLLHNLGVNYGDENIPAAINVTIDNNEVLINVIPGNESLKLKYQWICDTCEAKTFVDLPSNLKLDQSGDLVVQAYKNKQKYGKEIIQPFVQHLALGSHVDYHSQYEKWYTAGGDLGLVDGRLGTLDFRDGNWQGFLGDDLEVIVDLGETKEIKWVQSNFFQYNNSWIFLPVEVVYQVSFDGKKFVDLGMAKPDKPAEERGKFISRFIVDTKPVQARYVKLRAKNIKTVPPWHEAAGSRAWLFMDEIIVR